MGTSLLVGGIAMWLIDARNAKWETAGEQASDRGLIKTWRMDGMSVGQAVWIGACQILSAVFPGTSRSMATIAGGQLAGMSRAAALEFSFFVSIPTMFVATAYAFLKSVRGKGENPIGVSDIDAHQWIILAIGFVVSFIVAYGAVAWFIGYVRKRGFAPSPSTASLSAQPFCTGLTRCTPENRAPRERNTARKSIGGPRPV